MYLCSLSNTRVFTWSLLENQLFAQGNNETLYFASVCLSNHLVFLHIILIWYNILNIFSKKRKYLSCFLHFFLKCTLYSHIFMQTDNALYASAQMLKFINEFTKPLNLQRNPKDTYSLHCFISQKSQIFYLFFTKYSVFLMVLRNK